MYTAVRGVLHARSEAGKLLAVLSVPSLLTPRVLPRAELSAARLDGELFPVDDGWVCADEPDSPELRARALGASLPRSVAAGRLVMIGLTAAWLHGATDAPPSRHEVCSRSDERAGVRLPHRFMLRELSLADEEECRIGPLRVTTPERTAFDIGRREPAGRNDLLALQALVFRYRIRVSDLTGVGAAPLPGKRRSLDLIAAAAAQPPLTR